MKIVTVSREYGSGGRELAKKLATRLGFSYYDKEILKELAVRTELDEKYVEKVLEGGIKPSYGITFGHASPFFSANLTSQTDILIAEQKLVKEIASSRDCVIVGRNASVTLSDRHPFRVFVYGDVPSKIARCRKRSPEDDALTDKELVSKMKKADGARANLRRLTAGTEWGAREGYDLMINTSSLDFEKAVPIIADYVLAKLDK